MDNCPISCQTSDTKRLISTLFRIETKYTYLDTAHCLGFHTESASRKLGRFEHRYSRIRLVGKKLRVKFI